MNENKLPFPALPTDPAEMLALLLSVGTESLESLHEMGDIDGEVVEAFYAAMTGIDKPEIQLSRSRPLDEETAP